MVDTRRCDTCDVVRPLEDFVESDAWPDGYSFTCATVCYRAYWSEWASHKMAEEKTGIPQSTTRCISCTLEKGAWEFTFGADHYTAACVQCRKVPLIVRNSE